jgi:hypothetical protein
MSRFSYSSLSSHDFEGLARDLLQAEWGVPLEAFRSGRDKGIDLRYSKPTGATTIIQCKHYVGSGFGALLANLRVQELPKIKRLSPDRYVVVTSVALSPPNKDAIMAALSPFVLTVSDIYSAGDLDGLLSIHKQIVRDNFKLWLTSTEVLDRVIHNAEVCHAEFVVERIQRNIPRFVQGASFTKAMDLLTNQRVLVISGVPGIGKTTLAEMLLFAFLEQGFEPVIIQAEVAEGKRLYRQGEKQLFYFDDFLGQFFLGDRGENLGRNQDAALVDFIDMVRGSKDALFILTTREHLLQQALASSERFKQRHLLDARYVLELTEYSHGDKARILYNHLYFSDLPTPYRKEILRDDFFLEVIKHPNFNPRLIEWLSSYVRVQTTLPRDYQAFVNDLLTSPHDLWRHAFAKQISDQAQDALLALYTLGDTADTAELEPVWDAVHRFRSQKYNRERAPLGIRPALQELEGGFLSYSRSEIRFINPSIREFVAASILEEKSTAVDLLGSAIRFKQLENIYKLAESTRKSPLWGLIKGDMPRFLDALVKLLDSPTVRWGNSRIGRTAHLIDLPLEVRVEFIVTVSSQVPTNEKAALVSNCCACLVTKMQGAVNFPGTLMVLRSIKANDWFMGHGGELSYRSILDAMLRSLDTASAKDWLELHKFIPGSLGWSADHQLRFDASWEEYCGDGVIEEISNCSSSDDCNSLMDSLIELGDLGSNFDSHIGDLATMIEEIDRGDESLDRGDYSPPRAVSATEKHMTDDEVKQMFYTII